MFKKDCDEPHDAEIVATEDFSDNQVIVYDDEGAEAVCELLLDEDYLAAFQEGTYDLEIVFEASEPDSGDDFVCYLERLDGRDLEEPIVD